LKLQEASNGTTQGFLKDPRSIAYSLSLGIVEMNMNLAVPLHEQVALGILNEDGSKTDNPHWKTFSEGTATELVAALDPSLSA